MYTPKACTRRVSTPHGYQMKVHCEENDRGISKLIEEDTWEVRSITGVLNNAIKYLKKQIPGKRITGLDIGASIGMYTQYMAKRGVRVVAFEPLPENINIFEANVRMNRNGYDMNDIHLVKAALSTKDGSSAIYVTPENPGATSLVTDLSKVPWNKAKMDKSKNAVEVKRGDVVLRDLGIKSAEIIKINVQGHELAALKGLGNLESLGVKIIAVDFSSEMARANGVDRPEELFEYILDQGFAIWSQDEGELTLPLALKEHIQPWRSRHDNPDQFTFFAILMGMPPFFVPSIKGGELCCANCHPDWKKKSDDRYGTESYGSDTLGATWSPPL